MIKFIKDQLTNSLYVRNIFHQASGNTFAQMIGILGMPLLSRLYSPSDFALQNLFMQAVGFVTCFITFRYEYFIVLTKNNCQANKILSLVFFLGCTVSIITTPILWFWGNQLALQMGDERLSNWLICVPLFSLLICLSVALQNYAQRNGAYRKTGISEIFSKVAYIISGLAGSGLGSSTGLIFSSAASAVAKIIFLLPFKIRTLISDKPTLRSTISGYFVISEIKELTRVYGRLSGSLVYSSLMGLITASCPVVFIAHTYGNESLGHFTLAAATIYLPSNLIGSAIGQVYYQRAAELWSDGGGILNIWKATAKQLIFFGGPLYLFIALVSPVAYPFIFGDAWASSGRIASIMAIASFFSFITSPMDRTCLIVNAWWYAPVWHTARAITVLIVVYFASLLNMTFNMFLISLVIQMSALYLVDYLLEWHFASIDPSRGI